MSELVTLFMHMIVISLVSFGGGATALFYEFGVSQTDWITSNDLSAIIAVGYATPGPAVFGIGTFIGYRLAGMVGALVGTVGIFLMPWLLALLSAKYFSHWVKHPHARYFIRSVGLAAAGIVIYAAVSLMPRGGFSNTGYLLLAALAFIASTRWKINPMYLVAAGLIYAVVAS